MGWFILKHIFTTLFSFINIRRLSDQQKDLEILILRQQLSILQRKHKHPIKPSRVEKLPLGVLFTKFKRNTHQTANQHRGIIRIFQPETVLRWHRVGLTHFYSPGPNALRWGIVDKLQRSEKKGILRKSCLIIFPQK